MCPIHLQLLSDDSYLLYAPCIIVANLAMRLIFSKCHTAIALARMLSVPIIKALLQFSQLCARCTVWNWGTRVHC